MLRRGRASPIFAVLDDLLAERDSGLDRLGLVEENTRSTICDVASRQRLRGQSALLLSRHSDPFRRRGQFLPGPPLGQAREALQFCQAMLKIAELLIGDQCCRFGLGCRDLDLVRLPPQLLDLGPQVPGVGDLVELLSSLLNLASRSFHVASPILVRDLGVQHGGLQPGQVVVVPCEQPPRGDVPGDIEVCKLLLQSGQPILTFLNRNQLVGDCLPLHFGQRQTLPHQQRQGDRGIRRHFTKLGRADPNDIAAGVTTLTQYAEERIVHGDVGPRHQQDPFAFGKQIDDRTLEDHRLTGSRRSPDKEEARTQACSVGLHLGRQQSRLHRCRGQAPVCLSIGEHGSERRITEVGQPVAQGLDQEGRRLLQKPQMRILRVSKLRNPNRECRTALGNLHDGVPGVDRGSLRTRQLQIVQLVRSEL